MIGPVPAAERARRRKISKRRTDAERAAYLREVRDRAEWAVALLRYCEAANHPIVFRRADLVALRT